MRIVKFLILLIVVSAYTQGYSQTDTTTSDESLMVEENVEDTSAEEEKKNGKKDKDNDKIRPETYKDNNSLFEPQKRSWSIGAFGGLPVVLGDVDPQLGIGYGGYIRKALGSTVSLRLIGANGYASGLDATKIDWQVFQNNDAMNGTFDTAANYFAARQDGYSNFRMDFTTLSLQAVFNIGNINFRKENPWFGIHLIGGVGAMMFSTYTDQLDGSGMRYNYSTISETGDEDKKTIQSRLKTMLDGDYETPADGNEPQFMDRNLTPMLTAGAGMDFRIGKRFTIFLEASYSFTSNDILDGYQWDAPSARTQQPDAFAFAKLGLDIRLGRTDNMSWFNNPLSMPYKTILENKKKLQKVDKLEKQVNEVSQRMDTLQNDMNTMKGDADADGVSDMFDKEDNTPSGAIVNGGGETIFFKDDNGNLVYNDPNGNRKREYMDPNTGEPKSTSVFDKNQLSNKTVFLKGDGRGGLSAPGTFSSIGYMPAIFFDSDGAYIKQQYYPELYAAAIAIKQNPGVKVHVIGYTDDRASAEYNMQLGKRRAQAVADALIKNFGVPTDQLIVESKGEVEPLSNASTSMGRAANRRVQFQVEGRGTNTQPAPQPNQEGTQTPEDEDNDDVFSPDDF